MKTVPCLSSIHGKKKQLNNNTFEKLAHLITLCLTCAVLQHWGNHPYVPMVRLKYLKFSANLKKQNYRKQNRQTKEIIRQQL